MKELLDRLRKFRDERQWAQFHSPKNLAISISVEAAELLELFQWSPSGELEPGSTVEEAADEAADILIYLLLLFDKLGLDPVEEARKKIDRNEARLPAVRVAGKARLRSA